MAVGLEEFLKQYGSQAGQSNKQQEGSSALSGGGTPSLDEFLYQYGENKPKENAKTEKKKADALELQNWAKLAQRGFGNLQGYVNQLQKDDWKSSRYDRNYRQGLGQQIQEAQSYLQGLKKGSVSYDDASEYLSYLQELQKAFADRESYYSQFKDEEEYNILRGISAARDQAKAKGESYNDYYLRTEQGAARADEAYQAAQQKKAQMQQDVNNQRQYLSRTGILLVNGQVLRGKAAEDYLKQQQDAVNSVDQEIQQRAQEAEYARKVSGYAKAGRYADLQDLPDYDVRLAQGGRAWAEEQARVNAGKASERDIAINANLMPNNGLGGVSMSAAAQVMRNDTSSREPQEDWTEEEQNTFLILFQRSPEEAYDYAIEINSRNANASSAAQAKALSKWTNENGWRRALAWGAGVLSQPFAAADYLDRAMQYNVRGYVMPHDQLSPADAADTMSAAAAKYLNDTYGTIGEGTPVLGGKGWGDVFQLSQSIAQSAAAASMGGGATNLLFFGSAANQGYQDAKARGASDGEALILGFLNGSAEVLGETFSVEKLISIKNPATMRRYLWNVVKQGGIEASEETFTTILNTFADEIVMGDKSELQQNIRQLMAQGMSRAEAEKQAWQEWAEGLAGDALGGFLSGGISAGGRQAIGMIRSNAFAYSGEDAQKLVEAGLQQKAGSAAYKLAQKIQEQGTMSELEAQRLTDLLGEDAEAIHRNQRAELVQEAQRRLQEAGMGQRSAARSAETVTKELLGEELDRAGRADRERDFRSETVRQVTQQMQQERRLAAIQRWQQAQQTRTQIKTGANVSEQLQKAFKASKLEISQEDLEILRDGYGGGQRMNAYVIAMRDGYRLGKLGMDYEKAAETSDYSGKVMPLQFQHAWELGMKAGGHELPDRFLNRKAELGSAQRSEAVTVKGQSGSFTMQGLTRGADGTLLATVKAADGSEQSVSLESLDFGDSGMGDLVQVLKNRSDAEQMFAAYKDGMNIGSFVRGWDTAKAYGQATGNRTVESVLKDSMLEDLDEKTIRAAFAYGRSLKAARGKDTSSALRAPSPQGEGKESGKGGGVSYDGGTVGSIQLKAVNKNRLTPKQRAQIRVVEALGKQFGIQFVLFQSEMKNGRFKGFNGLEQNGVIYLDVNAGMYGKNLGQIAIVRTAAHELTHYMREFNEERYEELQEFLLDNLEEWKGRDLGQLVAQKMLRAKNSELDAEGALEEVVADGCEMMLSRAKMLQTMAEEKPGLLQAVRDWLQGFMGDLKEAFQGVSALHEEARAVESWEQEKLEKFTEIWYKGLTEAAERATQGKPGSAAKRQEREDDLSYENLPADAFFTDSRIYDYDFLTAQKPMKISRMPAIPPWTMKAKEVRQNARESAEKNLAQVGKKEGNTYAVKNTYTGRNIRVGMGAIRHSLEADNRADLVIKSRIISISGDLVQNAIPINGLVKENPQADGTYAMLGIATSEDATFAAVITVDQFSNVTEMEPIDVAHAINGRIKREDWSSSKDQPFRDNSSRLPQSSEITIAQVLDIVNETYKGILSDDVLKHFEEERPKSGYYSGRTLFQMREEIEETPRLVAVHNKSVSGLRRMLQRGGVPFPSIAIKKAGSPHEGFGDVSIVFPKSSIDPEVNRQNRLYSNDAWTPTEPRTEYDVGDTWRYIKKLRKQVGDAIYDGLHGGSYLEESDLARKLMNNKGDVYETLKGIALLQYAYLKSIGKQPSVEQTEERLDGFGKYDNKQLQAVFQALSAEEINSLNFDNEELRQKVADVLNEQYRSKFTDKPTAFAALGKKPIYTADKINPNIIKDAYRKYVRNGNKAAAVDDYRKLETALRNMDMENDPNYRAWIMDNFSDLIKDEGIPNGKDYYTSSGNPRSFKARHVPATLENIVRQMQKEQERGVGVFGTNLRGAATKNYSTVEEMRKDSGKLLGERVSDEVYDKYMEEFHNRLHTLADQANKNKDNWQSYDSAQEILLEAVRDAKTKAQMKSILKNEAKWINYSDSLVDDLWDLRTDVQNMPAPYFEAKPRRVVYPEEALAYILPDNADADVMLELQKRGFDVLTYKAGDEQDRLAKLNSLENAKFQEREEIQAPSRGNLGYHAGDLGKAEHLNIQGRDRGTGHFGTGTYFVGEKEKVTKDSYYGKRPQHAVDFTDYNLYKVRNDRHGYYLHDAMRIVDGGIKREWIRPALDNQFSIINPTGYYDLAKKKHGEDWALGDNLLNAKLEYAADNGIKIKTLDEFKADEGEGIDDSDLMYYYDDYVDDTIKKEIKGVNTEYHEFMDALFNLSLLPGFTKSKISAALNAVADYQDATPRRSRSDSYATVFMKAMGYEGVDVRGTGLDNTQYGSVIYDVKPKTVVYQEREDLPDDRALLMQARAEGRNAEALTAYQKKVRSLEALERKLRRQQDALEAAKNHEAVDEKGEPLPIEEQKKFRRQTMNAVQEQIRKTEDSIRRAEKALADMERTPQIRQETENALAAWREANPNDAARAIREMQQERDTMRKYVELLQQEARLTTPETRRMLPSDILKLARNLVKENGSSAAVDQIAEALQELGDFMVEHMQGGGVGYFNQLTKMAQQIARSIVSESYETLDENKETREGIRSYLKNHTLRISDDVRGDIPDFNAWRKKQMGTLWMGKDGLDIDVAYHDLQASYGVGLFPEDIYSRADQLDQILEALKQVQPTYQQIFSSMEQEQAAAALGNEIVDRLLSKEVREKDSMADRAFQQRMKQLEEKYARKDRARQQALENAEDRAAWEARKRDEAEERRREEISLRRQLVAEKVHELRERSIERDRIYKKRISIEKKTVALSKIMLENSGKRHVPDAWKVAIGDFLASIDTLTQRSDEKSRAFYLERVEALQKMVQRQLAANRGEEGGEGTNGFFLINPLIEEMLDPFVKLARESDTGKITLTKLSLEQLQELEEIMVTLRKAVDTSNEMISLDKKQEVSALAEKTLSYVEPLGEAKGLDKVWKRRLRKYTKFDNLTPVYYFKMLGQAGEEIFRSLQNGQGREAFNVKQIIAFTNGTKGQKGAYTEDEVKNWEKETHEFQLVKRESDLSGRESLTKAAAESGPEGVKEAEEKNKSKVTLSTAQIMGLYCLARREQARGHILGGGIRIWDIEAKSGTKTQADRYLVKAEDIAAITSTLTDRQKEVADSLQKYMNTVGSSWGNEVSRKLYGVDLFTEENYYPIETDPKSRAVKNPDADNTDLFRLANMGFTKSTVKNADNGVVLHSIFDVFSAHMSDMARYNAMCLPVIDAMKWFNYLDEGENHFTSVRGAIEKAYGVEAEKYFITLIQDINGYQAGRGDYVGGKMVSNAKVAAVGANLRVAFLQPTSYVRAMAVLDPKYMGKISNLKIKQGIEEAMQYSGTANWKDLGFFDLNVNANVKDLIKHADTTMDKIKEGSMWLAEKGDRWTWGALWNATKAEVQDKTGLTGEALLKATAERFDDVIYQTQVMDSVLTRSQMMRKKDGFHGMVTSFMAEPTLSYNLLLNSLTEWENAKRSGKGTQEARKKIARAFTVYALSQIVASFVESFFDALRDDDDYESFWEKWLQAEIGKGGKFMEGNLMQDLAPWSKLPYLRDLVSIWQGFTNKRMDTEWMNYWVTAIKALVKDWMPNDKGEVNGFTWSTAYKTMRALSTTTGLPIGNSVREVMALWNTFVVQSVPDWKLKTVKRGTVTPTAGIKQAFQAGAISEEDAIRYLMRDAEIETEEKARQKIYEWSLEKGEKKYDQLLDAVYGGKDSKAARDELLQAGYSEDALKSAVRSAVKTWYQGTGEDPRPRIEKDAAIRMLVKEGGMSQRDAEAKVREWSSYVSSPEKLQYEDIQDAYIAGEITAARAAEMRMLYGGKSKSEAQEEVLHWQCEKDTGIAYSDLKDAWIDGEISDAEAVEYQMKYGGTTKVKAEQALQQWRYVKDTGGDYSDVKQGFLDGSISEQDAIDARVTYGGQTRTDAQKEIRKWKCEKDTGIAYDDLRDLYLSGELSAERAAQLRMTYGGQTKADAEKEVQKWRCEKDTGIAYDNLRDLYLSGEVSGSRAAELRVKYGGQAKEDAEKEVLHWQCEKDTGIRYDDIRDAYAGGQISEEKVRQMLQKYGGYTETEAEGKALQYRFAGKDAELADISPSAATTYYSEMEAAGVSKEVWYKTWRTDSTTQADKKANGKAISGSKKNKMVAYIQSLNLNAAQKDALYLALGYAKSGIRNTPWH